MSSAKIHEENVLILDIQSSVVRGTLVSLRKGAIPLVHFTFNADIPYKPDTDSSYLIKTTLEAVNQTMENVNRYLYDSNKLRERKNRIKVGAVHYALSSPWIVSQAKIFSTSFAKPTKISRPYILSLLDKERSKLVAGPAQAVSVVEEKIFSVSLNGYVVNQWEGRDTKDLEVSFTVSVAGTRMIESFRKAAESLVSKKKIAFHSSLLLQYIGIEQSLLPMDNFSLVHIHGELTEIAIIRNRACAYFATFPYGVRTLIRNIAKATNTDEAAADSLLTLYADGQIDPGHADASIQKIQEVTAVWTDELSRLFTESNLSLPAPVSLMVTAWGHDNHYIQVLKKIYPNIPVTLLTIADLLPKISFDDKTEHRRLSALYAIALNSML